MDSFYEGPRQPPAPTKLGSNFQKAPSVPEVSVIDAPFLHKTNHSVTAPFHHREAPRFEPPAVKKSVRFERPTPSYMPMENPHNAWGRQSAELPHNLHKKGLDLGGKTFEQIYMANVPNRHLDLSIIEPPGKQPDSCKPPEYSPPRYYQGGNELRSLVSKAPKSSPYRPSLRDENYLKSIENFHKSSHTSTSNTEPSESSSSPEIKNNELVSKSNSSDEPSLKDLFRIIQQQNEQIMLLQHQMNNLQHRIQDKENQPQEQYRGPFLHDFDSPKMGRSKFSIDLKATSFEVSFRPPQNKFRKGLQNEFMEPKIQEIKEVAENTGSYKPGSDNEMSFKLDESLNVGESYVSELPSIEINMEDYKSSDEEETSQGQNPNPATGVTLYKDLMEQVNNVLQKMQMHSEIQQNNTRNPDKIDIAGAPPMDTMKMVKQATLQHLRSMGVNLPPIQESNEAFHPQSASQSEVSFQVKQLLMKYLPDDKLAQIMNNHQDKPQAGAYQEKDFKAPQGNEFSFATLEYMKKYNILGPKTGPLNFKNNPKQGTSSQKILDVTALKLQPKLL